MLAGASRARLETLGLDHVDLFLIHWPRPRHDPDGYVAAWRVLEELARDGHARSESASRTSRSSISSDSPAPGTDVRARRRPDRAPALLPEPRGRGLVRAARRRHGGMGPDRPRSGARRPRRGRGRRGPGPDARPGRPPLASPARVRSSSRSRRAPRGCARTSTSSTSSSRPRRWRGSTASTAVRRAEPGCTRTHSADQPGLERRMRAAPSAVASVRCAGLVPDHDRARRIDAVARARTRGQARERRPAPARRRAAGVRADARSRPARRPRPRGGATASARRAAVGPPVEDEVRRRIGRRSGLPAGPAQRGGRDEHAGRPVRRGARANGTRSTPAKPSSSPAARARGAPASATSARGPGLLRAASRSSLGRRERAETVEQPLDEVDLRLCERRVEPDAAHGEAVPLGGLDDVAARRAVRYVLSRTTRRAPVPSALSSAAASSRSVPPRSSRFSRR